MTRHGEGVGFVSLVGAGPGDPELLTVGGLRRLREADAVAYDRLVAPELLELCPPRARLFDVGKEPGRHGHGRQGEISALLVRLAQAGLRVVRFKGGDPFVFGRGGEEALALAEAGVPFEVVPGVSSALAAPLAAGIPVTHRGLSASVTIAAGREGRGAGPGGEQHDWGALARMRGTLVFLMPVETLGHIADRLIAHGRAPSEPAALVHRATTPEQRTIVSDLGGIAGAARAAGVGSPSALVVGETVALAGAIGGLRLDEQLSALRRSAA